MVCCQRYVDPVEFSDIGESGLSLAATTLHAAVCETSG